MCFPNERNRKLHFITLGHSMSIAHMLIIFIFASKSPPALSDRTRERIWKEMLGLDVSPECCIACEIASVCAAFPATFDAAGIGTFSE